MSDYSDNPWMRHFLNAHDPELWRQQYLASWDMNDSAVFATDRVMKWLESGEINEHEAEILLRLSYETGKDGKKKFTHY